MKLVDGIFYLAHRNLFTLTHHSLVLLGLIGNVAAQCAVTPFGGLLVGAELYDVGLVVMLGLGQAGCFRTRERGFSRNALHIATKLAACHVGSPLGHQAVGHELAAGYGYESLKTVTRGMIKTHDASAYASARRVVVGGHKGRTPA